MPDTPRSAQPLGLIKSIRRAMPSVGRRSLVRRYGRAIRNRIRDVVRRPVSEPCVVCLAPSARVTTVRFAKARPENSVACRFRVCGACGHVGNPENVHDYRLFSTPDALPMRARVGTMERPGREFHMARMATEIIGRPGLDVLVFGAGRSLDNHHIERLDDVRTVSITDIMRIRDDAAFIDADDPAVGPFDVVIASEVVEHFTDPRSDFARLFRLVKPDGVLVCSTNVFAGRGLERHRYPFIPGHTSYYTEGSLEVIAGMFGYHVDLRVPLVATGYAGRRKRYVLFTKSDGIRASIERYFAHREYAPSEDPWPDGERGPSVTRAG
jgi:SAM-dependent methyltransferase